MFALLLTTDWTLFIGRFHPILVHFPIGFLLLGLLLDWARRAGKIDLSENALTFIYWVSAIGATIACIAGYLLSLNGGYEEELLSSHMWRGIGVAMFAWLLWAVSAQILDRWFSFAPLLRTPLLWFSVVLVFSTGHLGGALTYGEDYLFQYAPEPFKSWLIKEESVIVSDIKPLANVNQAVVYQDIIQPILSTKCVQCHGPQKKKGDLRVDSFAQLMKGGEGGPVIIDGKGKESELVARALLPLSEDGHMPPKGKPQLTDDQILLLTWWINEGALEQKKVAEYDITDSSVQSALQALGNSEGSIDAQAVTSVKNKPSYVENFKPALADEAAIATLRGHGLLVIPLAEGLNSLEISAINTTDFKDQQAQDILKVKDQVTWLKLSRTQITDETVKKLADLTHLTKLNLEYNPQLSSSALKALSALPHLEYLNVIGTSLDDDGLRELVKLPTIRHLHVWQTKVTPDAIASSKEAYPHVEITTGMSDEEIKSFLEISQQEAVQ